MDLILIPCRPSTADLDAIGSTMERARLARRAAAVVLNQALVNRRAHKESRQAIGQYEVVACPARSTSGSTSSIPSRRA